MPENPAPAPPPPKPSALKKILYVLILLAALSLLLQFLGVNVLDHRERDTLIERPHAN